MLSVLKDILCAILNLGAIIIDLLVGALNGLIVAIGAAIAFIVGLLPAMPEAPDAPADGILAFINWFIPLAPIFLACGTILVAYFAFRLMAIALNWFKAL